jgi:hypothetical protein
MTLLGVVATLALASSSAFAARDIDLDADRARADDAAAILNADQRYLAFQDHRVGMLNRSWRLEIAKDHPQEAGILAVAHWKALQDERYARFVVEHARRDYVTAQEQLVADEYRAG